MKHFATLLFALFALLLYGPSSQAAVTITFSETDGDVIGSSTGSLITTGLLNPSQLVGARGFIAGTGFAANWACVLLVGTDPIEADSFSFSSWTNNNSDVCTAGGRRLASSGSGNFVGIISRNGSSDGFYTPNNYVSGSPIAGTSTWIGATFASLGLVPGTYVFTFGAGATADSITLNIGGGNPPPSTYTVGGSVSGLTGSVTLQNNGGDDIIKTTNDGFTFAAQAEGSDYMVAVSSQPTGQTCNVSNGSGTNITANITNVTVTCVTDVVTTYSVGGTVSGLTGTGLELQNNGADNLAVAADGPFTFVTELLDGAGYAVTISTQPTGQTCSVTNGSGTITAADVTNVAVACVDDVVVVPPTPATPVPTMSQWALIMLSMLLGLMVFANRKRLF